MTPEEMEYWERFRQAWIESLRKRGYEIIRTVSGHLTVSPIGQGRTETHAQMSPTTTTSNPPDWKIPFSQLAKENTRMNTDRQGQTFIGPTLFCVACSAAIPFAAQDEGTIVSCPKCGASLKVHELTIAEKARLLFGKVE